MPMPAPTGSRPATPARRDSTSWPRRSVGRNVSSRPCSVASQPRGETSASWSFWTWVSPARPVTPRYVLPACRNTMTTAPPAIRFGPPGLSRAAPRPMPRSLAAPEPALVAAIGEAVQEAVSRATPEPAPRPSAVAPEAVARALTEALEPAPEAPAPGLPEADRGGSPPAPPRRAGKLRRATDAGPRRGRGRDARLFHRLAALRCFSGTAEFASRRRTTAAADRAGGAWNLRRCAQARGSADRTGTRHGLRG